MAASEALAKADAAFRRALRLSLDLSQLEVDATRANHGLVEVPSGTSSSAVANSAARNAAPGASNASNAPNSTNSVANSAASATSKSKPGAPISAEDVKQAQKKSKGLISARRELQLQQQEALNTLLVEMKFLEMDFDAVESATTQRQVQEDISLLKREIALKDKLVDQVTKELSKWAALPSSDEPAAPST